MNKKLEIISSVLLGIIFVISALLVFLVSAKIAYGINYPEYRGYVNDFANIIPDETEKKLENQLSEYEKKTTYEITVVTIQSLEGLPVEDYSIHLAEKWKVGKAKTDNGVIFLTAVDDRKTRIEVGNGIEDKLTDIESGRILDQVTPFYKQSQYGDGIQIGINKIINQLDGQEIINGTSENKEEVNVPYWAIVLIVFLLFGIPGVLLFKLAKSPYTPIGDQGTEGITDFYKPVTGTPFISSGRVYIRSYSSNNDSDDESDDPSDNNDDSDSGSGFGGFGGGSFGGGGASRGW